jgi:hypothetical protein
MKRLKKFLRELVLEMRAFATGIPRPKKATLLVSKDGSCDLVRMPNNQLRSLDEGFRGKAAIKRWKKLRRKHPALRAFMGERGAAPTPHA